MPLVFIKWGGAQTTVGFTVLVALLLHHSATGRYHVMLLIGTQKLNLLLWQRYMGYLYRKPTIKSIYFSCFGLSAEIERNLISQRTKASLESVRATGKRLGRPFSAQSKKLKLSSNTKKVKKLLDMGLTKYRIAKIMQVKQSTVSRFIVRMGW